MTNARFSSLHGLSVAPSPSRPRPLHFANRALVTSLHGAEAEKGCAEPLRCILLGASNTWFPITLAALHVPTATKKLEQLVEHHWAKLEVATSPEVLAAFRKIGQLTAFAAYSDNDVWQPAPPGPSSSRTARRLARRARRSST